MKKLFLQITNYGIKPELDEEIREQHKLLNGISFLGVPVCFTYLILFGLTGYFKLSFIFLFGIIIFSMPIFLNKLISLKTGRVFISIMAPIFFGAASVATGKDAGFYLGFLVITVPPIIIFPKTKTAIYYILFSILCLVLSILGNMTLKPICHIPFEMAMSIFILNLFTVLITTVSVVYIFKMELNFSREKIAEKNKEITDSINYAKKIQSAYLPTLDTFHKVFSNAFLFFKPKDIVSGDFYWFNTTFNSSKKIIHCAVADCTGHGVPGALMSVICCNALNEAVINKKLIDTGEILNETRRLVKQNLKSKHVSGQKDGMDIALISIDMDTNELRYSGAYNPLWILQGNQIIEFTPDKQPIGAFELEKSFSVQSIKLESGDAIYLFSDGYADQFGGPKGKKFKHKRLKELIQQNSSKNMLEQKELLEKEFEKWKGNLEQVDDVCMLGIKI